MWHTGVSASIAQPSATACLVLLALRDEGLLSSLGAHWMGWWLSDGRYLASVMPPRSCTDELELESDPAAPPPPPPNQHSVTPIHGPRVPPPPPAWPFVVTRSACGRPVPAAGQERPQSAQRDDLPIPRDPWEAPHFPGVSIGSLDPISEGQPLAQRAPLCNSSA